MSAEQIEQVRQRAGLSQGEFAARAGTSLTRGGDRGSNSRRTALRTARSFSTDSIHQNTAVRTRHMTKIVVMTSLLLAEGEIQVLGNDRSSRRYS